jgi:hypothetical protein
MIMLREFANQETQNGQFDPSHALCIVLSVAPNELLSTVTVPSKGWLLEIQK